MFGPEPIPCRSRSRRTTTRSTSSAAQSINQLEPNQNNDAYGPDSANILYHAQDRLISSDNGGTTRPNPDAESDPADDAGPDVFDDSHFDADSDRFGRALRRLFADGFDHLRLDRAE